MTRFKFRKKLKGLLGPAPPEIVNHRITFLLPDGTKQVLEVEEHYSLLMAADAHGITISTGRRAGGTCPDGLCALCRVEMVDATGISELSTYEKDAMDDHVAGKAHEGRDRAPAPPLTPNTRLGCHAKIRGSGGTVRIPALFDPTSIQGEAEGD